MILLSHFVLCIKYLKRHCVMSVGRPVVKSWYICNLKSVVIMDVVKKNILKQYITYHQNTVKAGCEVGRFTE